MNQDYNVMNQIKLILLERCKLLEKELYKIKKKREKVEITDSKLKVCKKNKSYQYYEMNYRKNEKPKYISKTNIDMAKQLAQRDYENQLIKVMEEEIASIKLYLRSMPETIFEDVYDSLMEGRRIIVIPAVMTDEEYTNIWQNEKYNTKKIRPDDIGYETQRGEKVRSKSEVIIADALYYAGVPYHYEKPLKIGNKVIYPDFTVLNVRTRKEFYWEHLGMLDNEDYLDKALRKLDNYELHGIREGNNLILTRETAKFPINISNVKDKINHYLK